MIRVSRTPTLWKEVHCGGIFKRWPSQHFFHANAYLMINGLVFLLTLFAEADSCKSPSSEIIFLVFRVPTTQCPVTNNHLGCPDCGFLSFQQLLLFSSTVGQNSVDMKQIFSQIACSRHPEKFVFVSRPWQRFSSPPLIWLFWIPLLDMLYDKRK